jgi:hypothetical protein
MQFSQQLDPTPGVPPRLGKGTPATVYTLFRSNDASFITPNFTNHASERSTNACRSGGIEATKSLAAIGVDEAACNTAETSSSALGRTTVVSAGRSEQKQSECPFVLSPRGVVNAVGNERGYVRLVLSRLREVS